MPGMLLHDVIKYPRIAKFLKDELPDRIKDRQHVWRAFVDVAGISWIESVRLIHWLNDSPLLRIKQLNFRSNNTFYIINGRFDNRTPSTIYLSSDIAKQFEKDYLLEDAKCCVESTILHELVHLADYRDGRHNEPEQGELFELAAYNGKVSRWKPMHDLANGVAAENWSLDGKNDVDSTVKQCQMLSHKTIKQHTHRTPRGIRNNNPGNIKQNSILWRGLAVESDKTDVQKEETVFCVFVTPDYGIRAMYLNLKNYCKVGINTISKIIQRWAPPSDGNATDNYINFVAEHLECSPNQTLNLNNKDLLIKFTQSMIYFENGQQPYSEKTFNNAYTLLEG